MIAAVAVAAGLPVLAAFGAGAARAAEIRMLVSNAKQPEAARSLIKFLTAPATAAVLKAKGLTPG